MGLQITGGNLRRGFCNRDNRPDNSTAEKKSDKLANRIDIYIDRSAFDPQTAKSYLEKAKKMKFDITVHADQFSTGGSVLAVNNDALSADHLEVSSDEEIDILAKSNVIATVLPGASMGLGCPFAPARKLLDSNVSVAIASDWNPGSAPMGNLLVQAAVMGAYEKLTGAEVFSGITFRAAAALGFQNLGKLDTGFQADFNLFPVNHFNEILYSQGRLNPAMVWKKGELVHSNQVQ